MLKFFKKKRRDDKDPLCHRNSVLMLGLVNARKVLILACENIQSYFV